MSYTFEDAARRVGSDLESVTRYVEVGLIDVEGTGELSDEDIRRIQVFQTLEQAGLPIEVVAALAPVARLHPSRRTVRFHATDRPDLR